MQLFHTIITGLSRLDHDRIVQQYRSSTALQRSMNSPYCLVSRLSVYVYVALFYNAF